MVCQTPHHRNCRVCLISHRSFPDFIPVLGYIDDLILIPLGLTLAIKMIPPEILKKSRKRAQEEQETTPRIGRIAAGVIILIWVALTGIGILWIRRL